MPLQSVEQTLKDLKSLLDQGLITQIDYDAKKAQILEKL
jgi:outer membrane protein TolC